MTKLYLIHGWGGSPNSKGWFGWLIKECKKRNWELIIPEIPETDYPNTEKILTIFSTNDNCIPISDSKIFKEKLNAQIIIKENENHFNETQEINEIIEFIEK